MFNIILINLDELSDDNACYASGWFEITKQNQHTATLFKNRGCLVFLTLTTLLENLIKLKSNKTHAYWIGEDNGSVAELHKNKQILSIKYGIACIAVDFSAFFHSVVQETNCFLSECKADSPTLVDEGAYIDLNATLLKAKKLLSLTRTESKL